MCHPRARGALLSGDRRPMMQLSTPFPTTEKALKATGGAGFYRKFGLEQLLRDAHGAQFHPLPAKRQHHFTGQLALGLAPIVAGTAKRMRLAA